MILTDLMSIWTLKNLTKTELDFIIDNTITDERLDLTTLAVEIARVCGKMVPVYDTTDSYIMFHKNFFKKYNPQITKLIDSMELEYNPLETYSRHSDKHTTDDNIRVTDSTVESVKEDSINESNTGTNSLSAYNASDFADDSKKVEQNSSGYNSSQTDSADSTRTDTNRGTERLTVHGNNGLVSYQTLVDEERKLAEFNIYNWIIKKYSDELFYGIF